MQFAELSANASLKDTILGSLYGKKAVPNPGSEMPGCSWVDILCGGLEPATTHTGYLFKDVYTVSFLSCGAC